MAGSGRRERISIAERRERRGAVDDPAVVLEAAARFLEPRARSEAEVRGRLRHAGYRPELVDAAITRLYELGMLDDAAFARAWIESRDRARPRGERAIRQELAQKGIDREIVIELLEARRTQYKAGDADHDPGTPDEAAAARLLVRHQRALARIVDDRQRQQRAYALLARNGFDPDVCRSQAATVASEPPTVDEVG